MTSAELSEAGRQGAKWLVRLGRLGYGAKGVVYLVIGFLAIEAALGSGGQTTDSTGAVREIGQALHQFYEECPTLKESTPPEIRDARVSLFNATRIVVRNLLALLGVSAPEKM